MMLQVLRFSSQANDTLGLLFDVTDPENRLFLAFTLEDEYRKEKVHSETRVPADQRSHIHEPNQWILVPLGVLGVLSVFGGFLGPSAALNPVPGVAPEHSNSLANFLTPVLHGVHHEVTFATERWLAVGSVAVAGVGAVVSLWLYLWSPALPARIRGLLAPVHRVVANKFYVDELYDAVFVRPTVRASESVLHRGIDAAVIDDVAVNGSARLVRGLASGVLRHFQSGLAQGYLVVMLIGTILVAGFLVAR